MKRILIVGFSLLLGIYYVSLLLLGRGQLANQLKLDNHCTYNEFHWTPNIQFLSNIEFSRSSQQKIESIFTYRHNPVEYISIDNPDTFLVETNEDKYHFVIIGTSTLLPYLEIDGSENMREYVGGWKAKYIWCFFKWIKIEDDCCGMS